MVYQAYMHTHAVSKPQKTIKIKNVTLPN